MADGMPDRVPNLVTQRSEPASADPSPAPEDDQPAWPAHPRKWRRRVLWIAIAAVLLSAAIVLPSLVNMSRYQRRVTALVGRSMGRPARLSGVELRLLPSPGFILHDLAVSEDPAFGAEPVLSARTVVASVRLFALLRGKVEISRISVDEASLNLVRNSEGRWNLESLMLGAQPVLTATPQANTNASPAKSMPFPYLEATSSRINLKQGVEKSPFSITDTDFSLWQDKPGEWRVRIKGQPVRTDIEMSQADAGEIRMEATLGAAAALRDMPLKLQMDWREAQLGQLSRLISGSDSGWRGDVRADIGVTGTMDSAQTRVRLQATGVRREEFAPETPQDFDANCIFRYQHSQQAFHEIGCDTVIGDGRVHLKAELPGNAAPPEGTLEIKQVQLQAVLELLRTVRGGFAPGITTKGTANGTLTYKEIPEIKSEAKPVKNARSLSLNASTVRNMGAPSFRAVPKGWAGTADRTKPLQPSALTGNLTLDGVSLKGGALTEPLTLPTITLAPMPGASGLQSVSLGAQFSIALPMPATPFPATPVPVNPPASTSAKAAPAAATAQPIAVRLRLAAHGYEAAFTGSSAIGSVRQLAYAFGLPTLDAADALTGGTADLDLIASGPWIAGPTFAGLGQPATHTLAPGAAGPVPDSGYASDTIAGTLKLHHAEWRPAYLPGPVELNQGILSLASGRAEITSDFVYGDTKSAAKNPLRGTLEITATPGCTEKECQPKVNLRFGALDASAIQAGLIPPPAEKSLLSPLLNRIRSNDAPKIPVAGLNVTAESLQLGVLTVHKINARLRTEDHAVVLESWAAAILGGSATGTGKISYGEGLPKYTVDGSFNGVTGPLLGSLVNANWTGGPINGSGSLSLLGLTGSELATSADGSLKFDWSHGSAALDHGPATRFDHWMGAFTVKGGKATLGQNTLTLGKHTSAAEGSIALGTASKSYGPPADTKPVKPVSPPPAP